MRNVKKISYKALMKMTIGNRVKVMNTDLGPTLMEILTPTQLSELFPFSYKRQIPDIGGFLRALPTSVTRARQEQLEKQLFGSSSLTRDREAMEFADKLRRESKRSAPLPTLTPEQQAAWEKLQAGNIRADSPEAKVFASIPSEQLSALGIEKFKDANGVDMLRYIAPVISREEAETRLRTSGGSDKDRIGNNDRDIAATAAAIARRNGATPEEARFLGALVPQESEGKVKNVNPGYTVPEHSVGLWQINIKAHGTRFGTKEQLYDPNVNAKAAITLLRTQGRGAWANTIKTSRFQNALEYSGAGASSPDSYNFGGPVKPLGPNNTYTNEQIAQAQQEIITETNAQRRQQLANILNPNGAAGPIDITGTGPYAGGAGGIGKSGQSYGDGECVALSKHFSGLGSTKTWNFRNGMEGMVPGAVVATTSYLDRSGGRHASDMPDKKSHYHTGILLTYPDANGMALIYNQSKGHGAHVTLANVNNWNGSGEKLRAVIGGEPSERTREAVNLGLSQATPEQRSLIEQSTSGRPIEGQKAPEPNVTRERQAPAAPSNPNANTGQYNRANPAPEGQVSKVENAPKRSEAPATGSSTNAPLSNAPKNPTVTPAPNDKKTEKKADATPTATKPAEAPAPKPTTSPNVSATPKTPTNVTAPPPPPPAPTPTPAPPPMAEPTAAPSTSTILSQGTGNQGTGMSPSNNVIPNSGDMLMGLIEKTLSMFMNPTMARAFSQVHFAQTGEAVSDFHNSIGDKNLQ